MTCRRGNRLSAFQSTPPARGATSCRPQLHPTSSNFNPRPPRGGRRNPARQDRLRKRFQSTPPARGATCPPAALPPACADFNPRPPRGGRHNAQGGKTVTIGYFNPRPPRGGRLLPSGHPLTARRYFNPRPPRGGRPQRGDQLSVTHYISIHAPREGGDCGARQVREQRSKFQSTPPARGATFYAR